MAKTEYIKVTVGKEVYKIPSVECSEGDNYLAMLGSIVVKLHQRVEELERTVDDMRSIVGYGDEY